MRFRFSLICFCLTLSTISALAQESSRGSSTGRTSSQEKPDGMVCKKLKITGTHIRRRICRRRSTWRNLEEESQRAARDLELRGSGRHSASGDYSAFY